MKWNRTAGLLLVLLTGCASMEERATSEPGPPPDFVLPAGAPRNVRVGFVEAAPAGSRAFPLVFIPGTVVRNGYVLVTRDAQLRPTAILKIEQLHSRIGLGRLVRGAPQPKDEVVLPTPDLLKLAEALFTPPPGS